MKIRPRFSRTSYIYIYIYIYIYVLDLKSSSTLHNFLLVLSKKLSFLDFMSFRVCLVVFLFKEFLVKMFSAEVIFG